MIQITKRGVVLQPAPMWIEGLQKDFAERHCILLPRLIKPDIVEVIAEQVGQARFVPREHKNIGLESSLPQDVSLCTLHFLMNMPEFLRLIERVTLCGPIGDFGGRIYRMNASEGHFDSWHSDASPELRRLLTLSLNLSQEAFAGGELEIRDKASKKIIHKIANTGFGDVIVFRISPNLEHRVAPVRGSAPKTAFAGWFHPAPSDFHATVRSRIPAGVGD
jgi:hypothetical protein